MEKLGNAIGLVLVIGAGVVVGGLTVMWINKQRKKPPTTDSGT